MRQEGADTFRETLIACFEQCKREHTTVTLERLQGIPEDHKEEFLECHARRYVIDHLLAGLGWQIPTYVELATHSQNLQIEIGVESLVTGHRRFLDYFGFERQSGSPLMVIEAKRPSLTLPSSGAVDTHFNSHPASELFADYLQARHDSNGIGDRLIAGLTAGWRGYLDDLRDYVRSVANVTAVPRRAIITNGEWLVLFQNPEQAFVDEQASVAPAAILIFGSRKRIVRHYSEIYERCSYTCLAGSSAIVQPRRLPAVISACDVSHAMFGQRVLYCRDQKLFAQVPRIELTPLVHLCTRSGGFVSVESAQQREFQLGLSNDEQLETQRAAILQSAEKLKQEVESELGMTAAIPLRDISDHYEDGDAFQNLPGVRLQASASSTSQEFVLVTGISPHFLSDPATYRDCLYHDSDLAHKEGVLHEIGALLGPNVEPRAFFPSGSCFRCSHQQTYESKTFCLTETSRPRVGQRSSQNNHPFCELFQLDEVLCCRSCAFHKCCSRSNLFRLPCPPIE